MTDVVLIVLVIAVLLALVSLILPLADRVALPHTTLLAALGMTLGFLAVTIGHIPALGFVGDVLLGLDRFGLSADAFLFLFLPPLLFTAGLMIDVRLLFDELAAVLLMAVVAVVIATTVVGYTLNAVTDLGLTVCLLLGAIVATTDPAAVVSLFRDLGAPRRLTTLIAGESLFNDAAAIALFTLLLDVLIGVRQLDVIDGMVEFLIDFAGGVVLGYLLSRFASWLLLKLRNSPVAEITVTVSLAYCTYIFGDVYLEVSGVVAVVVAALTFSIYGRTRVTAGTWEPLVQTWHQLEFWANSLIFVLAAVLATRVLPEARPIDFALLAVMIVAALAARALVLYGLLPCLSATRLTQPIGPRQKAVILWGGLRGAVTMVLALSVSQNAFVPPAMQHFVAVLAIGFVLFTLFVSAPTLRPLLRLLGLDRLTATELALRNRAMALSRTAIREQLDEVARDYGFSPQLVERAVPAVGAAGDAEGASDGVELSSDSRLRVGLLTLANRERALYLAHFGQATISRRMVGLRIAAVDRILDRVKTEGVDGYLVAAGEDIRQRYSFDLALWLHRRFGWTKPLAQQLADHFEKLLVAELVIRELRRFNRRSVKPLLGAETGEALDELLHQRLGLVSDSLATVELQYPAFAEALRSQYLARAELRFEDAEYRRQLAESLISREVFNDLQRSLDDRRQATERQPPLDLGFGLTRMIRKVRIFEGLDDERVRFVARLLRPCLVMPGERVVEKGAPGKAMYFIASGRVEVRLGVSAIELGPGEFFGELALLTKRPRNADVVASTYCHLMMLRDRDFHRLLRSDAALRQSIKAVAEQRLGSEQALDGT